MNHNHNHSCICSHSSVKFCSHCNTVYCEGCNQEWSLKINWNYTTYNPWYQTLGGLGAGQYKGNLVGGVYTSGYVQPTNTVSVDTCKHGE